MFEGICWFPAAAAPAAAAASHIDEVAQDAGYNSDDTHGHGDTVPLNNMQVRVCMIVLHFMSHYIDLTRRSAMIPLSASWCCSGSCCSVALALGS
jgi:hypothetical protein